jgi:PAS domain S-box-containing protein
MEIQKELYLRILDQFPNPIWRSGTDGKCNYFNKAWLEFTGRTIEQEMGDGWAEGVHKEDFDTCLKTYLDAFKKREPFQMDYRLKHKDGSYHWILDSGSPFFNEKNEFQGYIGSCYDINRDREYKLLFSNMIGGFAYHKIIIDDSEKPIDYEFIDINKAFEQIVGLSRENIIGKRVTQALPGIEKDPANWIEKYGKIALDGGEIKFENYSEQLNKWFSVSAYSPAKGYFVTLFEDITSYKEAEKRLQEKFEELEKMNKMMVGRELKMAELKEQIEGLKTKDKDNI